MHHLAISVSAQQQQAIRARLDDAGVPIGFEHGRSIYFNGPDGERLELLAEPLGEMGGEPIM